MIAKIEALNSSYTLFVPINDAVDSGDKIAVSILVRNNFHFQLQFSHLHFSVLGAIQVLCNTFFWKLDLHPLLRNANNVEPYTFVTLFS